MRKEEKPAPFLFSLMQRYAFRTVSTKRAHLCRGLSKVKLGAISERATTTLMRRRTKGRMFWLCLAEKRALQSYFRKNCVPLQIITP